MGLGALSIGVVIAFAIGLYVVSAVIPGAIDNVVGANTTNWGAGETALWAILPLVAVAALLVAFIPRTGD